MPNKRANLNEEVRWDSLADRGQYRAFQRAYGKENQAPPPRTPRDASLRRGAGDARFDRAHSGLVLRGARLRPRCCVCVVLEDTLSGMRVGLGVAGYGSFAWFMLPRSQRTGAGVGLLRHIPLPKVRSPTRGIARRHRPTQRCHTRACRAAPLAPGWLIVAAWCSQTSLCERQEPNDQAYSRAYQEEEAE